MSCTTTAVACATLEPKPSEPKHIDMNGNTFELPTFTISQVHAAIPKHCFKRSITRGLAAVFRDAFLLSTAIYLTYTYTPLLPTEFLRFISYASYTVLAGLLSTGLWALAHECGHGALTPSKRINNIVGFILHSITLTPYFSFQITHGRHHKSTNDLQRDTVFVPQSRNQWISFFFGSDADPGSMTLAHLMEDAPLVTLWHAFLHQLLGWPGYLLDNASGQDGKQGFPQHSHFWFGEDNKIFKGEELKLVLLSDIGVGSMIALLVMVGKTLGWWTVLVFYFIPWLMLNHWIVAITFIQHTDGSLPHYSHNTWTFARGAAATIDHAPDFLDTFFFHNITSTHVLHHLVSSIPFYHAAEATLAIQPVLGKHYHSDSKTPLLKAFWEAQKNCAFVEESEGMDGSGVYFFRNLHGKGAQPRRLREGQKGSQWSGTEPKKMDWKGTLVLRSLFFDKVVKSR